MSEQTIAIDAITAALTPGDACGSRAQAEAILASLEAQGFVVRPREPTAEMMERGMEASPGYPLPEVARRGGRIGLSTEHCGMIWRAMCSTAPLETGVFSGSAEDNSLR